MIDISKQLVIRFIFIGLLLFHFIKYTAQFSTVTSIGRSLSNKKVNKAVESPYLDIEGKKVQVLPSLPVNVDHSLYEKAVISYPLRVFHPTSVFGNRFHPILKKELFHAGIDLRANYEPVLAFADGTVETVSYNNRSGGYLTLDHEGGVKSTYAHLSYIGFRKGEKVIAGQMIALSGNTGLSTSPHLHFGLKYNDLPVNPIGIFRLFLRQGNQ